MKRYQVVPTGSPETMVPADDGDWIRFTDLPEELQVFGTTTGVKHPDLSAEPDFENLYRRHNFNPVIGPYLHPDDHGSWVPYKVLEKEMSNLRDEQREERGRLEKRVQHLDTERRLIQASDLAMYRLMAYDIAHLFKLPIVLPIDNDAVGRLNEFAERFRDE